MKEALLLQDIANPTNGVDQAWLTLRLELGAQVAHVDFHDIGGPLEIDPPDAVQDDLAGEYLARAPQEERQQLVLGGRKFDLACATMGHACARIQLDVGIAQHLMALLLVAPQEGLYPRQQLFRGKGLDEIVIGSRLEAFYPVGHGVARCEHEDRHFVPCGAQPPRHLQPIESWEHEIKHDAIGWTFQSTGEGLVPTGSDGDTVAFVREDAPHQVRDAGVIIHDENVRLHHLPPISATMSLPRGSTLWRLCCGPLLLDGKYNIEI